MLESEAKDLSDTDYIACLENQNAYMVSLFYAYQRISDEEKKLHENFDAKIYYGKILQELTRITRSKFAIMVLNYPDSEVCIKISFDKLDADVKDIGSFNWVGDKLPEKIVRADVSKSIPGLDCIIEEYPELRSLIAAKITVNRESRGLICLFRSDTESSYTDIDEKMMQLIVYELENTTERGDLIKSLIKERATLQDEKDEQRKLLSKLDEMQNQLVQSDKMASIGQLAAGVAHEINNPIGYVSSNMSALETYVKQLIDIINTYSDMPESSSTTTKEEVDFDYIKEDIFELLKESNEGISRVRKIVQDLKDFSHVGETEMQPCNINNGVNSTLNIVNNEIKYKAEVVKNLGDLPDVECIASQINQVLMNLLVNAAHAINDRGYISITTQAHKNDWVSISITDTGSGIPEDDIRKIFNPFYTTKEIGKGTGLGLSIAYGIVQKHHGEIQVTSEVGVGTEFTIWLPIKQDEIDQAALN